MIYHYALDVEQQSKQWVAASGIALKRPKTQQSAVKWLATDFWDSQRIILTDYLKK